MFFRRPLLSPIVIVVIVMMSALTLLSGGCSIRENPPQNSQFEVKTNELGCMDNAGAQLSRFFRGTASTADVDAVWNCGNDALQAFMDKTHGAQAGSYSAVELRDFIAKYFIRNVALNDDLVQGVGVLKQALVGGEVDRLTVDEIRRIQAVFRVFRVQSQNLLSFMPLNPQASDGHWSGFGGLRWQDMNREYLDHFTAVLKTAASQIGSSLQTYGQPYSFSQFDQLIEAFIHTSSNTDPSPLPSAPGDPGILNGLNTLHANMAIYAQVKGTLLVPDAAQISSGKDWGDVLTTAARWAGVFVNLSWYADGARAAAAGEHPTQGAGLMTLGKIFDEIQSILGVVLQRRENQTLPFEELEQLVSVLPAGSLPASALNINLSLRPLFRRLIGGMDPGLDGRGAMGITPGILKKLQDEFYNWYEGQRFLETLYQRIEKRLGDQDGADYLRDTLVNSDVAAALWKEVDQQTNPLWNSNTKLAAARIGILLNTLRPLFKGSDDEITFPKYDEGLRYSLHDLMEKNWMQSLSRLLERGYATDVRADVDHWGAGTNPLTGAGVTLDEFSQAFNDFKPLGVELKFFNPADAKAAADRFREGNVFTYVSDGNSYLDMDEAATLLAFAISAKRKADRIHAGIAHQCDTSVLDPQYAEPLIEMECYNQYFFGNTDHYWDRMDELVKYYTGLTPANQSLFDRLLQTSGRTNGYQPGVPMTIDDTEGLVAALQYIEAIFTRFDVNDSGFLNPSEAENAFPVFEGTLQALGQSETPPTNLSSGDADLVFTYMLAKGALPGGKWDVILWYLEKQIPFIGDFKADRIRILQIFAALAETSTPKPSLTPSP